MPAPDLGALDPEAVKAFVRMVHDAAARALKGAADPGMLQLDFIGPSGMGGMHSLRFAIGDVEGMASRAISAASDGLNVYVEGRTVTPPARGRGKAGATRGVFAFVNDSDGDKGKAGALPIVPTWSVESSPGNQHDWIVLDRALTADEAEPLGRALRARIGSDSATAKLTQPYRVAGTPNFPDARKRARGRVTVPTRILSTGGPLWTAAQLAEVAPPVAVPAVAASDASARTGVVSASFVDLIATAPGSGEDRSGLFFAAVRAAHRTGMLPGDVEDAMRMHPEGCASKYLRPTDRLADEIARAWGKIAARVEADASLPTVAPTHPGRAVPVDEARAAVLDAIEAHFTGPAGVRAMRVGTGIGKTRTAARAIAADIRRRRVEGDRRAALYLVPTHRLGDELAELFEREGMSARVFRGRSADDPEAPGASMCLDMEAVGLALKLHAPSVSAACCKARDKNSGVTYHCPRFWDCGYQRQFLETPDVWIGAHDLLFSAPSSLSEIAHVTIDEAFWQTGLRIATRGITLDDVGAEPAPGRGDIELMEAADVAAWRSTLRRALRAQAGPGGVERRHIADAGIDATVCGRAYSAEWSLARRVHLRPGMNPEQRRAAARHTEAASGAGRMTALWNGARDLLDLHDDAASGRLVLVDRRTDDGSGKARAVLSHGVRKVAKCWADLPVMILDATLPDLCLLRPFFPGVEVVADIEAEAPHARVRQVLGAPTSAAKLLRSEAGRNREAVRRAILHCFVEAGRCRTLVVAQKDMAEWLREAGLPDGIALGHFGAIAGLDTFGDVGLLIVIGRTMPTVTEVETYAGAVTGQEPTRTAEPAKGARWFDKARRGLRLNGGAGKAVEGDIHPDPIAEAARWQIAEAGVLQAVGRARAVNRTAADPVAIEIWSDLALPLTVDEVAEWDAIPSGRDAEMLVDGIVLESPSDMAACWPKVWETAQTAKRWQQETTRAQNPIGTTRAQNPYRESFYRRLGPCAFRYRHPGERQKWRQGRHDPTVCPDPRAWLEARLGATLAGFENAATGPP